MTSYLRYLEENRSRVSLRDLAFTLQYKRSQFPFRYAITADTHESLCEQLRDTINASTTDKSIHFVRASKHTRPRITGIFPGQGAQWAGMGKELIERSPYALGILAELEGYLSSLPEKDRPLWRIRDELAITGSRSRISEAVLSQTLTTAVQILLVDLLDRAGLRLDAVVGHSSGEIGAAYAAGLISSEDAIRIAYYRGLHSKFATGSNGQSGSMVATGLTPEQAIQFCALPSLEKRIVPAAFTGPKITTLSGDAEIVDRAIMMLKSQDMFAKKLKVETAYHSFHMLPSVEPYMRSLIQCGVGTRPAVPPFKESPIWFSSLFPSEHLSGDNEIHWSYWIENLRSPVRFVDAVAEAVSVKGVPDIFLEIGPGLALKTPVFQIIADCGKHGTIYAGLLNRGLDSITTVSEALGQIWARFGRTAVNFAKYDEVFSNAPRPSFIKDLPTYPWFHDQEFWWDDRLLRRKFQTHHPPDEFLGEDVSMGAQHEAKWRRLLRVKNVPWLLDHKLNGVPVFPAAAYVAMATTAARRIFTRQSIEMIEIENIHFKRPISFDASPAVEVILTVTNIRSNSDLGHADFVIDFCSHQRCDELRTAAQGRINVHFGIDNDRQYPERMTVNATLASLDPKALYEYLHKKGYEYTGPFQAITKLQRRLDFSTGTIQSSPSEMFFHPAILDALFHSTFAAQSYPGDSAISGLRVPSQIRSIKVFPVRCAEAGASGSQSVKFQAAKTGPSEYSGSLHCAEDVGTIIQMEGFCTAPFRLATPSDDLKMFAKVVWKPYVRDARSLTPDCVIKNHEREPAMALERVAFFILRKFNTSISEEDEHQAEPNLQYLIQYARHVVYEVLAGLSPQIPTEWRQDTNDTIEKVVAEYYDIPDMRLLETLERFYTKIIRGQVNALSVLTEDGMLTELYTNGLGFPEANSAITHVVFQLTQSSPAIRILEVGGGTGAVTREILSSASYTSYTFTDVSTAFLGPAKEKFKRYSDKMTFSVFDLENDFAAQGFTPESFEVIVASNVLHALDNLDEALTGLRRLLKPGGYLVCLELPVSCRISSTVIIGGLPGCWAGKRSGRTTWTPAMTEQQWDSTLRKAGFSGLDAISPIEDEFRVSYRLFVAQAVDDRITALRDPLAAPMTKPVDSLMIIGDNTFGKCEAAERFLSPFFHDVIREASVEALTDRIEIARAVLCLTDIENHIFRDMTAEKLAGLKTLFTEATDILWVTNGCKSPNRVDSVYGHMMMGLVRSVRMEISDLRLRFVDADNIGAVSAQTISQIMMEWCLLGRFAAEGWHDRVLFAHDTELAIENGVLLSQGIVHANDENDRYNSQQRNVVQYVNPHDPPVKVFYSPEKEVYQIHGVLGKEIMSANHGYVSAKMLYSTLYAIGVDDVGRVFIGVGICGDGKHAIVLSPTIGSVVRVPKRAIYPISAPIDQAAHILRTIVAITVGEYIFGATQGKGAVVVLTSDVIFLSIIRKAAKKRSKEVVFITSDSAFESGNAVFIHRDITDTQIRRTIPDDLSLIVNLSNQSSDQAIFKRVISVLKTHSAKVRHLGSTFSPYTFMSEVVGDAESFGKIVAGFGQRLEDIVAAIKEYAALKVISVRDIAQKSLQDPFAILDWASSDRIPITVQPATTAVSFAPDKTYIIVGSSDLSQSLGEWMINSGARRIVMTSRNPNVVSGWAQDMESKDAIVDLKPMDVTSFSSVGQFFASVRSTSPPIAGVIHLGLSLKDSTFSNMSLEDLCKASDVKTRGSINLHKHLEKDDLDFFILTSSISYIAGNRGQSNYNAGNAFMTGLAHYRQTVGLPATVVHLGNVTGVGYITRVTQENDTTSLKDLTSVESLRTRGAYPISERDLQHIYAEAILASPVNSGRDTEIITGIREIEPDIVDSLFWAKQPLFAHLISQDTTTSSHENAATTENRKSQLSVRERLTQAQPQPTDATATSSTSTSSKTNLLPIIQQALIDQLSTLLQLDVQDINPDSSLLELGIDSLVATEVESWASKELKVRVPQKLIIGGATVRGVAEFVVEIMKAEGKWKTRAK